MISLQLLPVPAVTQTRANLLIMCLFSPTVACSVSLSTQLGSDVQSVQGREWLRLGQGGEDLAHSLHGNHQKPQEV